MSSYIRKVKFPKLRLKIVRRSRLTISKSRGKSRTHKRSNNVLVSHFSVYAK